MKFLHFTSLYDLLEAFPNEESCIKYLELYRWRGKIVSPFYPESKVYACKNNRYRCSESGKYFNVKTGTVFSNSKIPLKKWMVAAYIMTSHKKGISSVQLAKDIKVTQTTAWFMLHKIRKFMGQMGAIEKNFTETVEVDETYIATWKGKKARRDPFSDRAKRKDTHSVVIGMVERETGKCIIEHIPNKGIRAVSKFVMDNVCDGVVLMSDEAPMYKDYKIQQRVHHFTVNHSEKKYVDGAVSTNQVESLWSFVKWGLKGTYRFVSEKHLQNYMGEATFRFNNRMHSDHMKMDLFLEKAMKGTFSYKELISRGC